MASNLDERTRFMDELEEGEIDDDEDDEVICLLNVGTSHFMSSNGRPHANIVPRKSFSRNSKLFGDASCGGIRSYTRNEQLTIGNVPLGNARKRPTSKYRNRNQPLPHRDYRNRHPPPQNSGINVAYKSTPSYRPRMSDYSYKRQRLLTSIRQRSIRKPIERPRHEPSYEDLLEQYQEIKSQLRDLAKEEKVVHCVSSDESVEIKELDKENLKSDGFQPRKLFRDRSHSTRLQDSDNNIQSPKEKVESKLQKEHDVDTEEEIEELRKLALASALKGRKENCCGKSGSNQSAGAQDGEDEPTAVCSTGDNYEEVAMEIDSSSSSPMRISSDQKLSKLTDGNLCSHVEVNPDEDEDILRAIVLSSLTNKHLQKTSNTCGPVSATVVTDVLSLQKQDSLATVPQQLLISRPPIHEPLVINLNDDSDSESEGQCLNSCKPSVDSIDDLLQNARKMFDTKVISEAELQVPLSVFELPESDLLEYKRLKAEIVKREQIKANQLKGVAATNQESCTDISCEESSESPIPMSEYADFIIKLKNNEQKLAREREHVLIKESELSDVRREMNVKSNTLRAVELKVRKLKEQLLSSVEVVKSQRNNLQALKKTYEDLEGDLQHQKEEIHKLEEDCLSTGKKIFGDSYSVPQAVALLPIKRTLINSKPGGQKRKVVLAKSSKSLSITIGKDRKLKASTILSQEKAKLQQMEQEIAAKLEELRKRASKDSRITKLMNRVPVKNLPGSLVSPKLVSTAHSQKRERRHSIRTKMSLSNQTVASAKLAGERTNATTKKQNGGVGADTIESLFSEENQAAIKRCYLESISAKPFLSFHDEKTFTFDFQTMFLNEIPKINVSSTFMESVHTSKDIYSEEPFQAYRSPLLHLKSYRFSPYFRTKSNQGLSWSTYSHKLKAAKVLCRFDLVGTCNDDKCAWGHKKDYMMSPKEILCDIISYSPSLAGYASGMSLSECKTCIESYVDKLQTSNQDRMTQDELCVLLVGRVNESLNKVPPYYTTFEERVWYPNKEMSEDVAPTNFPCKHRKKCVPKYCFDELDPDAVEENDIRYFHTDEQDGDNIESMVSKEPQNVTLWLKLAYKKLNSANCSQDFALDLALNAMSRGLEANQENSEMWLHYLTLYSKREECQDLIQLCEQAIKFAPKYEIWWKYLQYSEGYSNKISICQKCLTFILQSEVDCDIKSHQILEILLYICQLNVLTDRFHQAIKVLEVALGRHSDDKLKGLLLLVDHMSCTDRCLTWLCYIHVLEFRSMPRSLFSPANSGLGKIVSKEFFILPWNIDRPIKLSISTILTLFMDALKNCVNKSQPASMNAKVCLPLYKNLIALQIFRGRKSSAVNICEQLMKKVVLDEVWILLSYVYFHIGNIKDVRKTLKLGLNACDATPRLFCFAAMFELSQGNVEGAKEWSTAGIFNLFEVSNEDVSQWEADSMYRHALGLPLPLTSCVPSMKPLMGASVHQKAYLWLNYCVLLITQDRYDDVEEGFETAILRMTSREDLEIIWSHYLRYSLGCASQSSAVQQDFMKLVNLIERCLTTVPCRVSLHGSPRCWTDYTFFNNVVDMYSRALDTEQQVDIYEKYFRMCPKNASLGIKLLNLHLVRSDFKKAWYVCTSQLEDTPCCLTLWKVAIYLAHKEKSLIEIRALYASATDALPYNHSLWKDFILFELSNGHKEEALQLIKKCKKVDVFIDIKSLTSVSDAS